MNRPEDSQVCSSIKTIQGTVLCHGPQSHTPATPWPCATGAAKHVPPLLLSDTQGQRRREKAVTYSTHAEKRAACSKPQWPDTPRPVLSPRQQAATLPWRQDACSKASPYPWSVSSSIAFHSNRKKGSKTTPVLSSRA